ncbi:MAG TPA: SMC family ATPase, partial [Acidimicrobiales bacterium]|nr:SMC family ATPase [Acidimicrobiales bacterium]
MKPIHLSMCAFGAFSEPVEVDFAALAHRGLFLVSGGTGTGKTTIFDAMSWALYGKMPRKQPHEVRSDHVGDATRCEVTFTFESGGVRYTVTRNPDQFRPAARNPDRLVKESGAATLVRVTDDGTRSELVADKVSDVARACEEIIGLDDNQFQRVILLPQGMFNAFLLANSKDREEILERLFGGEIYDRIVEELKAIRDSSQQLVGDAETAITWALDAARKHVESADAALGHGDDRKSEAGLLGDDAERTDEPSLDTTSGLDDEADDEPLAREELGIVVTRLKRALQTCRTELEDATKHRTSAQTAHDAAVNGARRFDDAVELRATLADLETKAEAVEADRVAAVVSAKARPIVAAAEALDATERSHLEAISMHEKRSKAIVAQLTELGTPSEDLAPVALQRELAELRTAHAADNDKLETRRAADEAFAAATKNRRGLDTRVEAAEAARTTAMTRTAEIDAELPGLRAAAVDPDTIRAAITAAGQLVEARTSLNRLEVDLVPLSERRARAAEEHRGLLQDFTDTQAPRLAMTLVSGEACPVCGSTDHPAPATAGDARVVGWDEVATAAERHSDADTAVQSLERQITELRGRLGGSATLDRDLLQQRVDELQADLERATTASATIAALEGERKELAAELERLTTEAARLGESRDQAIRDLTKADEAARNATEAAAGIDPKVLERRTRILERLGDVLDGYDELVEGAASAASLVESRRADLTKLLESSDHDDVAAARAVVWAPEREQAAIDAA